jgi:NAD(P)-dependent dehydrogenase (short-subunit alcohol dehydrogenase family)
MSRFTGKTVRVVSASGGIGAAVAQAFAADGASLALAARRTLPTPGRVTREPVSTHQADLTDPASLTALRDAVLAVHGRADGVVNATGYDARKSLSDHTLDDFRRTLDVNLLGAMLLTQTFLPVVGDGMIVHLGGFADGRLAFPFYAVMDRFFRPAGLQDA